ncbi:MAG TPA: hypothetical protein VF362_02110 [Demequinaceae bacterium]
MATFAVIEGPKLFHRYGDGLFASSRCTVTIDGASSTLTAEQADNAALIAATALRRGLPAHAVTVALAAAIQESDLRNLDYGDRDSVGLFQQRPSQGWGTVEQIRDPRFATNAFYDHLQEVAGWQQIPVMEAAQAVQRSGHPLGYADHEADARLWARALTGETPFGAVTCSLRSPKADPAAAASFAGRISGDFGSRVSVTIEPESDGATAVRVSSGEQSVLDAAATWSIAVASLWPVADVTLCDLRWDRAGGTLQASEPAASACTPSVVVRFATG